MFFVLLKKYSLDKKFNIICLNVLNFFFFFNGKKSFLLSGRSLTPPPTPLPLSDPATHNFFADSLTGELKYEIVLAFYHLRIYVQNSQIVFYKTYYNRLRILSWQRVVSNFDWRWVRPVFGDFFITKVSKIKGSTSSFPPNKIDTPSFIYQVGYLFWMLVWNDYRDYRLDCCVHPFAAKQPQTNALYPSHPIP